MFSETLTWNALRVNQKLPRSLDSISGSLYGYLVFMICLRRFWLRAIKVASEPAQKRFIRNFFDYAYGVTDEASDRTSGHVRCITDYFQLRKLTSAAYVNSFFVELGLEIPDEVMEQPALQSLISLSADLIVLANVRISLA